MAISAIHHPIWFGLSGTIICFSTGQWPNTPPGCVRAIWPRRRVMECCIRWPRLHNYPTSTQLRWFGMSWTAEGRKNSQLLPRICGNSFKTVGKAFLMKLVERMLECTKLSSRQRVATLKNIKYKTEISYLHKCSDPLLWDWKLSSGASCFHWSSLRCYYNLKSTCGKFNWLDMIWKGTHVTPWP